MNGQIATMISWFLQWLVGWLRDWGILVLATAAVVGPYLGPWLLKKCYAPKLDIEFKDKDPYCRHAKIEGGLGPYFCHFVVVNSGRSQADDCEAVLEKIWKRSGEKENLELQECKKWIPVNLKWSAEPKDNFERACFKTIYPGKRRYFCDIGSVSKGKEEEEEKGKAKEKKFKEQKKFKFELPGPFISQDNYLCPGRYRIQISVYSKNAVEYRKKATRETRKFDIDWDGGWTDAPKGMPKRLKMKML